MWRSVRHRLQPVPGHPRGLCQTPQSVRHPQCRQSCIGSDSRRANPPPSRVRSSKKYFGDKALAIFVKVPSLETLAERLKERGTESEESFSRRLFKAKFEMSFQDKFDKVLLNEDLADSLAQAQKFYDTFRSS